MSQWQPVPGHPRYEVSQDGEVRKVDGALLGQWLNDAGYPLVRLTDDGGRRSVERVHRLVASAFIENPLSLPCVNHIDNNRANNSIDNLEWCTQAQNLEHMTSQGRRATYWRGRRSPRALLTDEVVALVREAYGKGDTSYVALSKRFGASKRTIGRIINGEYYV